jgi:hypothetical protein
MASQPAASKKSCFCNHCRGEYSRRALDEHFLCATCRALPGVQGYRDPNKRGLENGGPEYWDRHKGQLNIVDDGEQPAVGARTPTFSRVVCEQWDEATGAFVVVPMPAEAPLGGTVEAWRLDLLAARELSAGVKVALVRLSLYGDYTSGGNIFPSQRELADKIGLTVKPTRRLLATARHRGWVRVIAVERWTGQTFERTSNTYQLCWPDGRRLAQSDNKRG